MEAQYSKLTIAQLRQKLVEKGVKMPSKVKKIDLVTRLIQGDSKGSMPGTVSYNDLDHTASGISQEVWIVETSERYSNNWYGNAETETKIVGVYINKTDAIRNAKISFANMSLYEEMYEENDYTFDKNAHKKMKNHGGLLCKFVGGGGESISVSIRRASFNKEMKSKDAMDYDDADDVDDYSSDEEEEEPEVGGDCVWLEL
eukprot:TRINITY_DN5745_c0_g1_i1.p1 TRINITY_DN5745_c0_g1~~TRINITY_DN5745_c0_g1_i1.p1  ORF type:complete len:201 (-),score=70.72 TRINITY_DN5745_c0_g1_i1:81-683(-)